MVPAHMLDRLCVALIAVWLLAMAALVAVGLGSLLGSLPASELVLSVRPEPLASSLAAIVLAWAWLARPSSPLRSDANRKEG